jgi:hypothetical protein
MGFLEGDMSVPRIAKWVLYDAKHIDTTRWAFAANVA